MSPQSRFITEILIPRILRGLDRQNEFISKILVVGQNSNGFYFSLVVNFPFVYIQRFMIRNQFFAFTS